MVSYDSHIALKDGNSVASAIFESSTSSGVILRGQIDQITGRILVDNSGSSGITLLTATGTVNGLNTTFTFVQEPTVIVSDNATYRVNFGWTWNSSTLTATMAIAPSYDVFGIV